MKKIRNEFPPTNTTFTGIRRKLGFLNDIAIYEHRKSEYNPKSARSITVLFPEIATPDARELNEFLQTLAACFFNHAQACDRDEKKQSFLHLKILEDPKHKNKLLLNVELREKKRDQIEKRAL